MSYSTKMHKLVEQKQLGLDNGEINLNLVLVDSALIEMQN